MKHLILGLFFLFPVVGQAYVSCVDIPVNKVEAASGPGYHGFNNGGASGSTVFITVDVTKCTAMNQEDLSGGGYLVIDNYGASEFEIHKYWASVLLTASSSNKTITFHAQVGGLSNSGAAVLKPYFLRMN